MSFVGAILVSLLLHGVLALSLAYGLAHFAAPDSLASLDLSSVELSFADEDDDAARPAAMPAAPEPPPVRPPRDAPPPPDELPIPRPPEPDDMSLPQPESVRTELPEQVPAPRPREERPAPSPAPTPPPEPVQARAPRQARVDAPPHPKKVIRPEYPKGARLRGEQGNVQLEFTVEASGGVSAVRIVRSSGFSELDEAAVRAVRAARFEPAKSGREAVASTARLTLGFSLRKE